MSDYPTDPTLVAVILVLEAVELRLAEAASLVSEALTLTVRGQLNGAIGAVVPLTASLPEASSLIESVMVLHRHGRSDTAVTPSLFPEEIA